MIITYVPDSYRQDRSNQATFFKTSATRDNDLKAVILLTTLQRGTPLIIELLIHGTNYVPAAVISANTTNNFLDLHLH